MKKSIFAVSVPVSLFTVSGNSNSTEPDSLGTVKKIAVDSVSADCEIRSLNGNEPLSAIDMRVAKYKQYL